MHKIVDGKKIELSAKEEEELLLQWENDKIEKQQQKADRIQALADKEIEEKQKIRAEILKMKEEGLL